MKVYFDNAASTELDPAVFEAMTPYLLQFYGNPSSIHSKGRETRSAVEKARKKIAELINAAPAEIFFTSGGTEADNTAIVSCIETHSLTHAVSSELEHHAVLHTLKALAKKGKVKLSFVNLDQKGHIDLNHLEGLLQANPRSFVSLMHANNEIGNITDIHAVGEICSRHKSFFHSDTVQTISHIPLNLQEVKVDYLAASAHKFHGPKGVGFLFVRGEKQIAPFIHGGAQERNMRGGTENVAGIVGMAKALEIAYSRMEEDKRHILSLKNKMISMLKDRINDVEFNGDSASEDQSLFTVLNASLPASEDNEMLLFNLDIKGISASGGSACTSGSVLPSHVLTALGANPIRGHIRFSFGRHNTEAEVDYVVDKLEEIFSKR